MLLLLLLSRLFLATSALSITRKMRQDVNVVENAKEDAYLSPPQLMNKYGYPAETHPVVTKDGYILNIFRIPHGQKKDSSGHKRKVVVLNHGLLMSSADWITAGPDKGLGYILADVGYDVWLINNRGTTYSLNHTYLSPKSQAFWNFDWHEMGIYDLPAVIDYILGVTKHAQVIHIGHSQGTTCFYVFLSLLPQYNSKIEFHISLAPVAYVQHIRNIPTILSAAVNQPIATIGRLVGYKDYVRATKLRTKFSNAFCAKGGILQPVCLYLFGSFFQSTANLNKSTYAAIAGHYPAGSSWKQLVHYAQLFNSGYFRQYDYGAMHNRRIYNRTTPPEYDLGQIKVQLYLIGAPDDIVGDKVDIDRLERELPNVVERLTVPDRIFNHLDFLWGKDAPTVAYPLVLRILKKHAKEN